MPPCPPPSRRRQQRGVTLIEMLVVVVLISLMVGITVPAFQAGLPTIRLRSASSEVAQFLYAARNDVERSQLAVQVQIDARRGILRRRTVAPNGLGGPVEEITLPQGVEIAGVGPALLLDAAAAQGLRTWLFYPGAAPPAVEVVLRNDRNARRWVRLDPITLSPMVLDAAPPDSSIADSSNAR